MFWIDREYILLVIPAMIFAMYAQSKVTSTFAKYKTVLSRKNVTAADAARTILNANDLYDMAIERVSGNLTDHYDPKANVIRLSDSVYSSTSVASIGVAAHEAGHAIQHSRGYVPIKMRNAVLPVANIGTYLAFPLVILGIAFSNPALADIGVVLFAAVVAFQVVTLPVEFNASNRALAALDSSRILYEEEVAMSKKVLSAAAMTYVAATVVALANLLRLLSISRRSNR